MMRHDSGQWKTSLVTRSHHLRVSNSILFVWYNIYIVSVRCMFGVSSHFFSIHSPHFYFYLQTGSLHSPYTRSMVNQHISRSIGYNPHHTTSIHHPLPSLLLTSLHPRFEDCRLVEWAQMTHKNIHHVFPPCGQTSTSTKQPSICVPICAVLI